MDFTVGVKGNSFGVTEKSIYFNWTNAQEMWDEDWDAFSQVCSVDGNSIEHLTFASQLIYKEDKLWEAFNYYGGYGGEKEKIDLTENELGRAWEDIPVHKLYFLTVYEGGPHQIGGTKPANLILPEGNLAAPIEYLGFIDNQDVVFSWLPFRLHLLCPLQLDFELFFLDYSNPVCPIILNLDELAQEKASLDFIRRDSKIIYEITPVITFNERKEMPDQFIRWNKTPGQAGAPDWLQWPTIPRCPKTNKVMRFLCQLNSQVVKTSYHNIEFPIDESDFIKEWFNTLNFGDGNLYVFFQPESKVACYFIQST